MKLQLNNPNSNFPKLVPINEFNFDQICLEPTTLLKMIFSQIILWVNSHKHVLYVRYLIGLLQLFKTLTKGLVKDFVLQKHFSLLAEFFISRRSTNPVTCDMNLFATIVTVEYGSGCLMWQGSQIARCLLDFNVLQLLIIMFLRKIKKKKQI